MITHLTDKKYHMGLDTDVFNYPSYFVLRFSFLDLLYYCLTYLGEFLTDKPLIRFNPQLMTLLKCAQ